MFRRLIKILLILVLGSVSFNAVAQIQPDGCGPEGSMIYDGPRAGFCSYPPNICGMHFPGRIPVSCIIRWQRRGLWPEGDPRLAPEPCKGFNCPGNNTRSAPVRVEAHGFGVVGRDDATGKDTIKQGGDGMRMEEAVKKECPNCRLIFWWVDSCAGQARAKQANGQLLAYYGSAKNAAQAKQQALNACKKQDKNPKSCSVVGADCWAMNP